MKKVFVIIAVLFIASPAYALVHNFLGAVGGTSQSLDGITSARYGDNEYAIGVHEGQFRVYQYAIPI